MSKYSDKYSTTVDVTYGVKISCTDLLDNLYEVNEDFDNSILYTTSDFLEDLKIYKAALYETPASILDGHSIKAQEPVEGKLSWGVTFGIDNTYGVADTVGYQWGSGDKETPFYGNYQDVRFVKNLDVKNCLFRAIANIDNTPGSTIENIVNAEENSLYRTNDQLEVICYVWDGTEWKYTPINACLVLYNNETILSTWNIADLIKLNRFNFTYYREFLSYFFQAAGSTRLRKFTSAETKAYVFAKSFLEENVPLAGYDPVTNPIYDSDFMQLVEYPSGTTSTVETNLKVPFISKLLACLGIYFTDIKPENSTKSFDTLLSEGHIWLGEMDEFGRTTGNWLHTPAEIKNAYNYDINTENEKFDPDRKPDGDDLDYEYDSDKIPLNSNTPFVDVGIDVWAMTRGQVGHMFGLFNGNTLPKDFEPLNQTISLAVFPMNLDSIASAATTNIYWGYRAGEEGQISRQLWPDEHYPEPIQGRKIGNVIRTFNLGSIDIAKELANKWNCPFLDYDCSVEVYCPWVGVMPVDVNKVMGKTITVYLTVDFISGDCTSVVYCNDVPIAYGSGVCSAQIPLSSQEYGLYRRKASDAIISTALDSVNIFGSQLATERVAANFVGEMMPAFSPAGAILAGASIVKNVASTISGLKNTRGTTTMTGSFGGLSAFANPQKAYVTIMRPVPKIPRNYNSTFGHIALETKTLASCKGLTSACNIDVSGLSCTTEERNAIKAALENGVRIK